MWLENWSRIRRTTVVWPPLTTKNRRGDRRLYHVTKRLGLRMSKPTSSPTRCSICEVWVTNQSKPGRTKFICYLENRYLKDLNRIDGEPMEFEWTIFTTLGILEEIQKFMTEWECELEQVKGRIIFLSMYNDTIWGERWNKETCEMNSVTVANYARRFLLGRWSFWWAWSEKKIYGNCSGKPDGDWDKTAERNMLNFAESGHPLFRATSALKRG